MRPRKVGALPRTIFLVFEVSFEFFNVYFSGGNRGQGTKGELITYARSKNRELLFIFLLLIRGWLYL